MPRHTKCTPKSPLIQSRVMAALLSRDRGDHRPSTGGIPARRDFEWGSIFLIFRSDLLATLLLLPSPQPAVDMSAPSVNKDPPPSSEQSLNLYTNYPNTPSPIQYFIAEVDRKLGKIEGQLSQVYYVRDRPIRIEENDQRIIDLHIAGCRNISPIARLRRGLSQRSLATEFDKWE